MTDITTRYEELKRRQDTEKYVAPPAYLAFPPLDLAVDTISKADSVSSVSCASQHDLKAPPATDKKTFEAGLVGLRNLDVNNIFLRMMNSIIEIGSYRVEVLQERAKQQQVEFTEIESRRMELINQRIKQSKQLSLVSLIKDSLIAAGLIVGGTAAVASGAGAALGVTAMVMGVVTIFDNLLDDAAKKVLASWIARKDEESKLEWESRLKSFFTLSAGAFSLFLSGASAPELVLKLAQGTASSASSLLGERNKRVQADILEIESDGVVADSTFDQILFELEKLVKNVHHKEQVISQIDSEFENLFNKLFP